MTNAILHTGQTAVLHLLSCPKIQLTWRSVQCLLCCRVYYKATAAPCSHPAVASNCTIDGASLHGVRRINMCHCYLPESLNSSRTWCRCRDRPSSTAASCLGNVAYGCHPCHRLSFWQIFHGFSLCLPLYGEVIPKVKPCPFCSRLVKSL